jgi:dienelactone hydrolase
VLSFPSPDGLSPVGGYPGNDDDGRALQAGLDQAKLRMDMLNSARYLKAHQLSTGKLGVTGFCWGGGTTNYLAVTLGTDMHAGVPFYGAAAETSGVPSIKAPLLIHYAENDERINAMWPAFETALNAAGVPHEMHKYPGHAARLPQQLDAALRRACRQARLGPHHCALQEVPCVKRGSLVVPEWQAHVLKRAVVIVVVAQANVGFLCNATWRCAVRQG